MIRRVAVPFLVGVFLSCLMISGSVTAQDWQGDVPLGNAFSASPPALIAHEDELHLIYRSRVTANLYHASRTITGEWSGFRPVITTDGSAIATTMQPAAVPLDGRLYIVYRNVSTSVLRLAWMEDGRWSDAGEIVVDGIPLVTDRAPAAAVLGDKLYVAYKSAENSELCVAWMCGTMWSGGTPVIVNDGGTPLTDSAPGLASFGDNLYAVYKSFDGLRLYWAWYDGAEWHGDIPLFYETATCNDFAETDSGPTLVAEGDQYLWLFTGDAERPVLCHLKFDGQYWYGEDEVMDLRRVLRPGAAYFDGHLYIAYKGWGTNELFWAWR